MGNGFYHLSYAFQLLGNQLFGINAYMFLENKKWHNVQYIVILQPSELLLAIYELIYRIFPTSIIKTKYTKGHEMYKKSVRGRIITKNIAVSITVLRAFIKSNSIVVQPDSQSGISHNIYSLIYCLFTYMIFATFISAASAPSVNVCPSKPH